MAAQPNTSADPFSDHAAVSQRQQSSLLDSTLPVGNDGSLTFGPDGLLLSDECFNEEPEAHCFGLFQRSIHNKYIPYRHILNADVDNNTLTIRYVRPVSNKKNANFSVRSIVFAIPGPVQSAEQWTGSLLRKAYGDAQRKKRIKVLINPYGGSGKAHSKYYKHIAPIFEAAGCVVDVQRTTHRGHAVEIAQNLDIDRFDVLASASGDGLPMECFNGLGKKKDASYALKKIAVVQLPCGTGNAMSWNLNGTDNPSRAALGIVKGIRSPLDLVSITQGENRTLSFLSQSLGIVAESDLGTDNIRWMGDFRFTFGFIVRLIGKTIYPIDYAVRTEIEDKESIKQHYAEQIARKRTPDPPPSQLIDLESDVGTNSNQGLPPLKYGTINEPLPKESEHSGWSPLEHYENLGNFYCGNMCWMSAGAPFFPTSLPNDGMLDLVTIDGDVGRSKSIKLLLSVENGTFMDEDVVRYRKVSAVRVYPRFGPASSKGRETGLEESDGTQNQSAFRKLAHKLSGGDKTGYFSVDGEALPFEPFQIEIHKGLGTVLSQRPGVYEYEGPKPVDAANVQPRATSAVSLV